MFDRLIRAFLVVGGVSVASAWTWPGVFPEADPVAVLIRYHTPNVYRAVVAWYYVAPGVAVFLAGPFLISSARIWFARMGVRVGRRSRLPRWPLSPSADGPAIVVGEVHHPVRAIESPAPEWLTIPERGLYTGVAIFGAVGSGKTSACMHPFARQLFGWQADNPERRAAALVLEVKGDFCHDIRRMLTELDRGGDYIELSLDGRLTWNPRRRCRPLRRGGRCLRWSVYDALTYGRGDVSENITLRPGDSVFVPRAEVAYVFGAVRSPGKYVIRDDTTVLQALSLAGGGTEFAALNRIRIVRTVAGEQVEIRAELSDRVQPDDRRSDCRRRTRNGHSAFAVAVYRRSRSRSTKPWRIAAICAWRCQATADCTAASSTNVPSSTGRVRVAPNAAAPVSRNWRIGLAPSPVPPGPAIARSGTSNARPNVFGDGRGQQERGDQHRAARGMGKHGVRQLASATERARCPPRGVRIDHRLRGALAPRAHYGELGTGGLRDLHPAPVAAGTPWWWY